MSRLDGYGLAAQAPREFVQAIESLAEAMEAIAYSLAVAEPSNLAPKLCELLKQRLHRRFGVV